MAEGILPSHRGSTSFHTRRRSIATRTPLHIVADLDRDFMSIVPWNPNHQRCLPRSNSMRNKKTERTKRRSISTKFVLTTAISHNQETCNLQPFHLITARLATTNAQNGRCPLSLLPTLPSPHS